MKTLSIVISGLVLGISASATLADSVGGGPKADFAANTLTIPCVKVEGLNEQTEGMFYDIVLERRGSSFNYELIAAEAEDTALCQAIADLAEFEDDDFDEDGEGETDEPALLAQCEVRTARSSISVEGKNLEDGEYFVVLASGENSVESMLKTAIDDEVEFDFDSNETAILDGAEEVAADFIVEGAVSAELFAEGGTEALLSATATCLTEEEE